MKLLITGGAGFLGSNLAEEAIKRRDELFIFDNLTRLGSAENLAWIQTKGPLTFVQGDIRSWGDVHRTVESVKPDVVFHLAGQVAMTTSIANPRLDFETNTVGTHNVLESVRLSAPNAIVIFSSTNKVYGDLEHLDYEETSTRYTTPAFPNGLDETVPLDFRSPYGCSKGAADQYLLDYARIYGLKTLVFRHSSIFGQRQFSTVDQGWIGWFVDQALRRSRGEFKGPLTLSGNGKQVRDVLFSSDLVSLYFGAIAHADSARGQAFNIGGGIINSLSLLELFEWLGNELQVKLTTSHQPARQSDQKVFVADVSKAAHLLSWSPKICKDDGLRSMLDWVRSR